MEAIDTSSYDSKPHFIEAEEIRQLPLIMQRWFSGTFSGNIRQEKNSYPMILVK